MITTLTRADEATLALLDEEKGLRKTSEVFILFPMGSQFDGLIKQHLDMIGVFCVVANPATLTADDIKKINPKGIIISGGPMSAYSEPPPFDNEIFNLGIPVFGICLGFQMIAKHVGCEVLPGTQGDYGVPIADIISANTIFFGLPRKIKVLQSHGDVVYPGHNLEILASTLECKVAAGRSGHLYGTQFHPETSDTEFGRRIFENFCLIICRAKDRFPARDVAKNKIREIRKQVGDKNVLLALSGGCDSSVVAHLFKMALEVTDSKVRGVYIKGLDRPDDEAFTRAYFENKSWIELVIVDATERFATAMEGLTSMSDKRKAMRKVYKEILEAEIERFGGKDRVVISQGTLYTDISESGGGLESGARKAQIKLHHNFNLDFSVPEILPLGDQVKDTARNIGRAIGVPEELLVRHPFPGPGRLIRVEGLFTLERSRAQQHADGIWIEELRKAELYNTVWQAGATLLASEATYSRGDDAGLGFVFVIWAVWSVNGFTARPALLDPLFIARVSERIANEVLKTACVAYRYTGKPPGTIEFG